MYNGKKIVVVQPAYNAAVILEKTYKGIPFNIVGNVIRVEDFIFDNELIALIFYNWFEIAEATCPTKYFEEALSINFRRSLKYGFTRFIAVFFNQNRYLQMETYGKLVHNE